MRADAVVAVRSKTLTGDIVNSLHKIFSDERNSRASPLWRETAATKRQHEIVVVSLRRCCQICGSVGMRVHWLLCGMYLEFKKPT